MGPRFDDDDPRPDERYALAKEDGYRPIEHGPLSDWLRARKENDEQPPSR